MPAWACRAGVVGLLLAAQASMAQLIPVATWDFNNTLDAQEDGIPALTAVDPLAQDYFVLDTVFGDSKWVYRFGGAASPATSQGGLLVSTEGILDLDDKYSVDIVFMFDVGESNAYNNILGSCNRSSDNALYIGPSNKPELYPHTPGPTTFTYGEYHRLTLVNRGDGTRTAVYLNGAEQFYGSSTVLDFSTYSAQNPDRILTFFLDNTVSPATTEYAPGRVALVRLYDVELSSEEVSEIPSLPEPATLAVLLAGAVGIRFIRRPRPGRRTSH